MRSSRAPRSMRFGVRSRKLSSVHQSLDGWPKLYYLELLRVSHWARVVGYGPFSLCVIHEEGLCPCSGDINTWLWSMHSIRNNGNKFRYRDYRFTVPHIKSISWQRVRESVVLLSDFRYNNFSQGSTTPWIFSQRVSQQWHSTLHFLSNDALDLIWSTRSRTYIIGWVIISVTIPYL
jgi:hypothetical protein